jgi:hypothetical protein
LACRSCQMLDEFQRCYVAEQSKAGTTQQQTETEASIFPTQESIVSVFTSLEERHDGAKLLSSGAEHPTQQPWVASIESFLSPEICNNLIQLGDSGILDWKSWQSNSETERYHQHQYMGTKFNETTTSSDNLVYVVDQVLSTLGHGAQSKHTTYVELLRFDKMQSYAPKHSYRPHEEWKPAGPRILTVVICLQESEEGGNLGFPNLDWMFLDLKQGDAVVWSNVAILGDDGGKVQKLNKVEHELLPVVEGEERFAVLHIHARDWKSAYELDCT